MGEKKVIYISGPISGVPKYYEAFEKMEDELSALGYIPLSPARLPQGMTKAQYMRICFAMIDSADAVVFLQSSYYSGGMKLEKEYCTYTSKPTILQRDSGLEGPNPHSIMVAWLKHDLEEVLQ